MSSSHQSMPENTSRRQSFLDYGGANSLNNFASSFQRAQTYLEVNLPESANGMDNISPCTSRESPGVMDIETGLLCPDNTAALHLDYGSAPKKTDLNSFHFPGEEEHAAGDATTALAGSIRRRRESSFLAAGSGRSTAPQTVFNAVNTLMGVAMLLLPFGFRLSGWVLGVVILGLCAFVTSYTAKVLGTVLRKNKHVHSYADIAYLYGGSRFLAFATVTFAVDLVGALLSLILIFSDSFSMLFPEVRSTTFKLAVTTITLLFSFLPLSLVSLISLVGIICTLGIFGMVVLCGLAVPALPGSLLHPALTSLWPSSGADLLLSLGIFMAPWGGHPVFPELYRDMRHPAKYGKSCNITFLATIILDLFIATVGYLMFGDGAEDSITKNIIANSEYPNWIRSVICVFLGLLPVCKLALVTRPVISVYESQLSLAKRPTSTSSDRRQTTVTFRQCIARVVFMGFLFALSIAFTSFGKVVAFLGSAICFTICMTLPLLFHLKLNSDDLSPFLALATKVGVAMGILGAVLGTYGSFLA